MRDLGVGPGRTVVVHATWDQFYNFDADPLALIALLLELVGDNGTLVMPAYPVGNDPTKVFDVRRTPTRAGLLAEIFRRYPGVKRSINFAQSVCAFGPAADFLVRDHHKSLTPWDENSPYYRLRELDSISIGFGVNHKTVGFGTVLHCTESILRDEIYYFRLLFGAPIKYRYRDWEGRIGEHTFLPRIAKFKPDGLDPYLDKSKICIDRISNLRLQSIRVPYLIDRMIELGRNGITMYRDPKPDSSLFRLVTEEDRDEYPSI